MSDQAAAKLIEDLLRAWATKSSPTDRDFYNAGRWYLSNPTSQPAYSQGGPATAAAAAWRYGHRLNGGQLTIARDSIDWVLAPGNAPWWLTDVIPSMMFAQDLGTTRLLIPTAVLGAARAARWDQALSDAADVCAYNGRWWSNGNINLGYAMCCYLAARVTGSQAHRDAYQRTFAFALRPGDPKLGLIVTKQPTKPLAADGAGYLTEAGGFDPDYTQVQLDVLTRLYVLSGDPWAGAYASMLLNQLLPRVQRTGPGAYQLDTSGGSRHTQPTDPFTTAALQVLARAGRTELQPLADAQWPVIDATFRGYTVATNPVIMKRLGGQPGVLVLDALCVAGELERVRL